MAPPSVATRDINTIIDKTHGRTELHLAAIKGSTYEIRRLINLGHNPGIKDNYGKTASSLSLFFHGRDLVTAVQSSDCRAKNEGLRSEIVSLKRKLEDLTLQHSDCRAKNEGLRSEIVSLKRKLDDLTLQHSDCRTKNEDLRSENVYLKRKLDELVDALTDDLKKTNDELVDALSVASERRGRKRNRTSKGGGGEGEE
jgi:FtsZ-binding cell division protein ZapB